MLNCLLNITKKMNLEIEPLYFFEIFKNQTKMNFDVAFCVTKVFET